MNRLLELDSKVFIYIDTYLRNKFLDTLMIFITTLSNWFVPIFLITLVSSKNKNFILVAVSLLMPLAISITLTEFLLKPIFRRLRPEAKALLVPQPKSYSFPSGHSSASFSLIGVGFNMGVAIGGIVFILAGIIAFSRIYIKAHYFSDVLIGSVLGMIISLISIF